MAYGKTTKKAVKKVAKKKATKKPVKASVEKKQVSTPVEPSKPVESVSEAVRGKLSKPRPRAIRPMDNRKVSSSYAKRASTQHHRMNIHRIS
jgi:hypothetical protein